MDEREDFVTTIKRRHAEAERALLNGEPDDRYPRGRPARLPPTLGQQPFACSNLPVDHELLIPGHDLFPQLLRPQPARLQYLQHGRRVLRDVRHALHTSTVRPLSTAGKTRLTRRTYASPAPKA